jgi:hypothetical protein
MNNATETIKFLILYIIYHEKFLRSKWRLRVKTLELIRKLNLKLEDFTEFLILFNKAENELIKEKLIYREKELILPKSTRYRYTLTKKGEDVFKNITLEVL